jgi:hypothetical protein
MVQMACWFSAPDWFGLRAWSAVSQHAKAEIKTKCVCVGEKEEQLGTHRRKTMVCGGVCF